MSQQLLGALNLATASIRIHVRKIKFLFTNRHLMSNKAIYYLLNGGQEPTFQYLTTKPFFVKKSYYLQSYIDKRGRQRIRSFDSYFTKPSLEGTELATFRLCKGSPNYLDQFYFQTLEKLAEYHEQNVRN